MSQVLRLAILRQFQASLWRQRTSLRICDDPRFTSCKNCSLLRGKHFEKTVARSYHKTSAGNTKVSSRLLNSDAEKLKLLQALEDRLLQLQSKPPAEYNRAVFAGSHGNHIIQTRDNCSDTNRTFAPDKTKTTSLSDKDLPTPNSSHLHSNETLQREVVSFTSESDSLEFNENASEQSPVGVILHGENEISESPLQFNVETMQDGGVVVAGRSDDLPTKKPKRKLKTSKTKNVQEETANQNVDPDKPETKKPAKRKRKSKKTKKIEDEEQLTELQKDKKKSGKKSKSSIVGDGTIDQVDADTTLSTEHQFLMGFLDVSNAADMVELTDLTVRLFSDKYAATLKPSIDMYNLQLQGWAKKSNMEMVDKVVDTIKSNGIKLSYQSYAAILECLGRKQSVKIGRVCGVLDEMKESKFEIEKLFQHITFSSSQRESIMRAIVAVNPDYKPEGNQLTSICNVPLLENIYRSKESLEEEVEKDASRNNRSGYHCLFDSQQLQKAVRRQINIELGGGMKVKSIESPEILSNDSVKKGRILEEHVEMWRQVLKSSFMSFRTKKTGHKWKMDPFYFVLQPDEYIEVLLNYIPQIASSTEGESLLSASNEIGSRLFKKYDLQHKQKSGLADKISDMYKDYVAATLDDDLMTKYQYREYWQKLDNEGSWGPSLDYEALPWGRGLIILGIKLTELLLKEIKIDVGKITGKKEKKMIPAFYHMYAYRNIKQVGFLKPHPMLVDLIKEVDQSDLWFDSEVLPMLSPPLPWNSIKHGGYLLTSTKVMRSRDGALQHEVMLEKTHPGNLYPVYDSLNQLGAVPWQINQRMLDLIIQVFRDKGSEELDVPQPVSECPEPPKLSENLEIEELTSIRKERMALRRQKAEMHSLRMDFLYKLSIANKFRDETFWFPHNMDFRGRVYPCPPHFNHLGNDPMRSILLFARGRALGEDGLKWLKIHLVNLTGFKKRNSLQERLEYADTIMDDILDSADNPTTGNKWWQTADEPWQTLSCCMEVAKAVRSPDPTKFISHLPVHQDGSCNGLQHYAALGRDVIGAQQVNLHPFDVPQDVYSGVAQKVEEARAIDAANGLKIAIELEGFVNRKIVKQTVMTVVYGVTKYGGHRQIVKQLKDLPDFPGNRVWAAGGYLVTKVFQSLGEMFTKTREIQDWFNESCKMISRAGRPMEWVTPLGLPIIQPYHKKKQYSLARFGTLHSLVSTSAIDVQQKPDVKKQVNAFAPNFIHSLDSSHMMLTSLHCQRAGITFVSVHDCYWTHASTVDIMNRICREQFVSLHRTPILENLSGFMVDKYSHLDDHGDLTELLRNVPGKGEFDLNNVIQSTYFFS